MGQCLIPKLTKSNLSSRRRRRVRRFVAQARKEANSAPSQALFKSPAMYCATYAYLQACSPFTYLPQDIWSPVEICTEDPLLFTATLVPKELKLVVVLHRSSPD